MKHQKSLDQCFCQFLERQAPLHIRKAPLLKTFWPRFCETRTFISDISTHPAGIALPRTAWVRLNRFRNHVGRFRSCLHKWDKAPSAACQCGAEEPPVDYVVRHCPIHRPLYGALGDSGWRDNRIAAQHLLRDLVRPRPSRGLQELAQTMKKAMLNHSRSPCVWDFDKSACFRHSTSQSINSIWYG